ncbi:uncharacterized protein LOC106768227 [Vigna radiata var. radiata]|uniref:Uncharacterized protein LOC106768227 n=1 Tax=Vigna radiata var. radiata TaxID=3916 RepID=A0A3Q0F5P3_VIGRR|nr:uncharacterized protein LOC106768227 [Vigna radiata var. radiata]
MRFSASYGGMADAIRMVRLDNKRVLKNKGGGEDYSGFTTETRASLRERAFSFHRQGKAEDCRAKGREEFTGDTKLTIAKEASRELMAPKRDWFGKVRAAKKGAGSSSGQAVPVTVVHVDDTPPSPEEVWTRKRKVARVEGVTNVLGKGKTGIEAGESSPGVERTVRESGDPSELRPLPQGMWDPGFDLRHKIEFHFDAAEEKVMASMSEQQMSEFLLDVLLRAGAAAFKMVYASNRGEVQSEVNRLRKELDDLNATHASCEEKAEEAAKALAEVKKEVEGLRKIGQELKTERDNVLKDMEEARKNIARLSEIEKKREELEKTNVELRQERTEWKQTEAEMMEAIDLEHTKGFKKALRQMNFLAKVDPAGLGFDIEQDIYEGRMVSIDDIHEGTFTEEGDPVVEAAGQETGTEQNEAVNTET